MLSWWETRSKLKDIDEGENPSILFTTVAIHTNKEPNQFRFFM